MSDHPQEPKEDLKSRIESLKAERERLEKGHDEKVEDSNNMRLGLRAGTELIAAIIVGGGIGHYLDKSFDTKPLFFLALLVLGVITGFVNVWRVTQNIGTAVGIGHQLREKQNRETKHTDKEDDRGGSN